MQCGATDSTRQSRVITQDVGEGRGGGVLRRACFAAVHFGMAEGAAAAGVRPPNAADALHIVGPAWRWVAVLVP